MSIPCCLVNLSFLNVNSTEEYINKSGLKKQREDGNNVLKNYIEEM